MNAHEWHAEDGSLRAYRDGDTDLAGATSVEAHLLGCDTCRRRLAALPAEPVMERAWGDVVARIATPPPSPAMRVLRHLRLPEADAVLLRAARSLEGSWTLATVAVIAFAALAALGGDPSGRALYLLLAPLVPVVGVVAAFASSAPLGDLESSTPYPKARLALLRTAAVCGTSIPIVILFGAAVPPIGWLALAWLVPAVTLTLAALVAMTWCSPTTAGVAVGAVWLAVILAAEVADRAAGIVSPPLLAVQLVLAALAAALLTTRLRTAHAPGGYR